MDLKAYQQRLHDIEPLPVFGRVRRASGLVIESDGPPVSIGEICEIHAAHEQPPILSEVIGFRGKSIVSMPIYAAQGIKLSDRVVSRRLRPNIKVGNDLLGRVIDGDGNPLDSGAAIRCPEHYPLHPACLNPLTRQEINVCLGTGVRCVDGLLCVGRGQRIGIFGGSGVGKSTLLGMTAKNTEADVNVIGLVGERGREVRAFLEKDLGQEALKRSVVVVSTSDNSPLMRIRAALAATSIAEWFRDQAKHVLLVMDSVTRVAMAQREVGLAAGEPPSSKGYTPSVFALLPRLFERAGKFEEGSITGFYTILVEGDDMNDPVADNVRSLLDGHFVLSRELAQRNHFPAIDVLESTSRLMPELASPGQSQAATKARRVLATYRQAEDMINIGAYKSGTNPEIDFAIAKIDRLNLYLQQNGDDHIVREEVARELETLMGE